MPSSLTQSKERKGSGNLGNRRTMIPIKGFADEEYARGCLQYYNEQFMVKNLADFVIFCGTQKIMAFGRNQC